MGSIPFTARVGSGNYATTIVLSGELDIASVPALEEQLAHLEADGVDTIKLDLRHLSFIDSMGLSAFLRAWHRAESNGHRIILIRATPDIRRLLSLTRTNFLLADEDDLGQVAL